MPLSKNGIVIIPYKSNERTAIEINLLDRHTLQAIRLGAYRSGKQLVEHGKREILKKGNRTGRIYEIPHGSGFRKHRASAKGEYPASIKGNLWRSLGFETKGSESLIFGAGKSGNPASKYARILELGGLAGKNRKSKIEPRKYLEQTIDANDRNITNNITIELAKKVKAIR